MKTTQPDSEQCLVKPFGIQLLEAIPAKEPHRTRTGVRAGAVMPLHSMDVSESGSTRYNT